VRKKDQERQLTIVHRPLSHCPLTIDYQLYYMAFKFENLQIWQKAFTLTYEVHNSAITFPKNEMFNLASQIKRAGDSVVLNRAEGSTGLSNAEFATFLTIALRSAIEVVACLMLARKRNYANEEIYLHLYTEYEHLCRMITKFRDNLK